MRKGLSLSYLTLLLVVLKLSLIHIYFTADPASGGPQAYRGKCMGFTVDGTTLNGDGVHPTGLNYLKRLGVTHVQLQPIFDFADRKSTRLNSSHSDRSRMPSSA